MNTSWSDSPMPGVNTESSSESLDKVASARYQRTGRMLVAPMRSLSSQPDARISALRTPSS